MIQKAHISDNEIATILKTDYSLDITHIEFLPVGEGSWCYRVIAKDQSFFIKLIIENANKASVLLPYYLEHQCHYPFIFSAIKNNTNDPFSKIHEYAFYVYPFIEGVEARATQVTPIQWNIIGKYLAQLHTTNLPTNLLPLLKKETFIPKWTTYIHTLFTEAEKEQIGENEKLFAKFINEKKNEINNIVKRTNELGNFILKQPPALVLCHGDIHTANIFITPKEKLYFIDWDTIQLAPIERDLMFFSSSIPNEFMYGYDPDHQIKINPIIIAYYKYEWVLQEFSDFGNRIFFSNLHEISRKHAYNKFQELFAPHDVIQDAYDTESSFTI